MFLAWRIMPLAERLSSKFHICPRRFASQPTATVYSHEVTAAILVLQNKETADILVCQAIPPGIKINLLVFCLGKPIWPLAT